jgi:flagellar protein FliO/FliZ
MNQSPEFIYAAIKMIIVLGLLLGGLVLALHLVKKLAARRDGQTKGRMIRVLANTYLGVKKSVSLVEVPGCVLVLGVTADRINLLARIDDPDTLETLAGADNEAPRLSFSDHIQKLSSRYKREKV